MATYESLKEYLGKKSERPGMHTKNNTRIVLRGGPQSGYRIGVIFHSTEVVTFHEDGRISMYTGGWWTSTTKSRINEYLPYPWVVYSMRGKWLLAKGWNDSDEYLFHSGITIMPDGSVTNEGHNDGPTETVSQYKARIKAEKEEAKRLDKEERIRHDIAYKAVRVVDGKYYSLYDSVTEYVVGKTMKQLAKPNHGGGYYSYADVRDAIDLGEDYKNTDRDYKADETVVLKVEIWGHREHYWEKTASTYLKVLGVVDTIEVRQE